MDFEPLCRICIKHAMECVDLSCPIDDNSPLTYLDTFNSCTNLQASIDDNLPKNLCYICAEELKNVVQFLERAKESDIILKERLKAQPHRKTRAETATQEDYDIKDDGNINAKDEIILFEITTTKEETSDSDNPEPSETLSCSPCKQIYETKDELDQHVKTNHWNGRSWLCNVCGKTYAQKSTLTSHLLKHKGERPYKCSYCPKSYFTKNGLQIHSHVHDEDKQDPKFVCTVCDKAFATRQRLRVHDLVHTGEKNYECTLCSKKFATPFRLRNHIRIHTGERPFECKECGLKFTQSNALRCHMRIHTGEKPYECKICGKRFNQNTILKTHMTLHTGKTVKCPDCDKMFSRPSYLILHQREHTGEKPYVCHKCPNRYKQKSHLDRHLDTHFGVKHACPECGKEYSKKSSLKIHMFEHSEVKPFQCGVCALSFNRKDRFRYHLKKVHDILLINNQAADMVSDSGKIQEIESGVDDEMNPDQTESHELEEIKESNLES